MKKSILFAFVVLISASFGCKTKEPAPTPVPSVQSFVDDQSPKDAAPFFVGDSLLQTKKNWQLFFR